MTTLNVTTKEVKEIKSILDTCDFAYSTCHGSYGSDEDAEKASIYLQKCNFSIHAIEEEIKNTERIDDVEELTESLDIERTEAIAQTICHDIAYSRIDRFNWSIDSVTFAISDKYL